MGLLSVTSPSTNFGLITIEDLPGALRGTNSSNDARLTVLIERVSRTIPRHLGRIVARQTYQEDVPGYGDPTLPVMVTQTSDGLYPGGPITTVASVFLLQTENSTSGATQSTNFQLQHRMAGELYKQDGWDWTAQLDHDLVSRVLPRSERPLWRVSYTAGFTLPQVGTPSGTQEGNLPFEIRQAAVDTVSLWFHREQRDPTVTRRRIGDVEIQYGTQSGGASNPMGLAESAGDILNPWKRVAW